MAVVMCIFSSYSNLISDLLYYGLLPECQTCFDSAKCWYLSIVKNKISDVGG